MRTSFLILLLLFTCNLSFSQNGNYTAFTVNEGLPSNHVYQCVEDDHGFLWVATDAGIARFDGKFFQVFTTKNGLPDNEVLQVVKDNSGTIWVNCFRQSPAYFDEVKNRFIGAAEDNNLAKITGTTNMHLYALGEGGVIYTNEKGSFIFRNKKLTFYPFLALKENTDGSFIKWLYTPAASGQSTRGYVSHFHGDQTIDSIYMEHSFPVAPYIFRDKGNAYIFDSKNRACYMLSGISTHPLTFKIDSVAFPENFYFPGISDKYFYILSNTAKIYVYDKDDLRPMYTINGDYIPNGFYEDSKKNLWISTVDKGLLVYRKKQLSGIELPTGFARSNFLSVVREPDGKLLAGNYYGEVIEINKHRISVHKVVDKTPSRQRKILIKGKDIYTVSEDGIYVNYKHVIKGLNGLPAIGKTAIIYDDTTILIGSVGGTMTINTRKKTVTAMHRYKRVTAMAKSNNSIVYLGSTDGLYKYDIVADTHGSLANYVNERITGLCFTPGNLLWVATSGNGIIVLKDEKPFAYLSESEGIINNSCRSITPGKDGQVWLGTSQGISIIRYDLQNDKLNYSIKNLSVNDGLTSNEINEMYFSNETMFIATGNGISVVPADLPVPSFNIPVRVTAVTINQRDTLIGNNYQLGSEQQNIQVQFAGIEIDGHFKHLEYTLNNKTWIYLNGRILTLQLNSGTHILQVRAVDVHGHISNKTLTIRFEIATPFWKTVWFWIIMAVAFQALVLYFIHRWQKERKEIRLSKEIAVVQTASLEQQAFTSLMNPHFIFNALNSIQHYINLQDRQKANRYLSDFASLIRKNFEASQQSFISLEQELDNIKIYLRLEQMRFADRFTYHIMLDEKVDTEGWMIPTMMLQPILENAILHGIMPSPVKGELRIEFSGPGETLFITIADNGIGVQQSLASKQNDGHKSHGMELIRKRIKALGNLAGESITIDMFPAYPGTTNPGNKIQLKIPADLYNAWLKAIAAR